MTENGCDVPGEDSIPLPGVLNDTFRVDFYRGYVQAAQETVTYDRVPLKGYFAWSLLGAPWDPDPDEHPVPWCEPRRKQVTIPSCHLRHASLSSCQDTQL